MADYLQEPVTLPVKHLATSASFYLSALQPLGFGFITEVPHSNSTLTSQAIGIGPQNSTRIDLLITQSGRDDPARAKANGKTAHVVFPALSSAAVRDFYAAALNAGGRIVNAPEIQPGRGGLFTTTVADIDGNKVEVCYSLDSVNHSEGSRALVAEPEDIDYGRQQQRWSADLSLRSDQSRQRRSPPRNAMPAKTTYYPVTRSSSMRNRAPPKLSSPVDRSNAERTALHDDDPPRTPAKTVVSTVLGAAAGVAIAYVVTRSTEDSRQKEAAFNKRMHNKEQVKAEARASQVTQEMPRPRKTSPIQRRATDRDSGYYSSGSRKEESPIRWRAATYPAPRRSSADKYSYRPSETLTPVSPSTRRSTQLLQSSRREDRSRASSSTAKPHIRSFSLNKGRDELSRSREPRTVVESSKSMKVPAATRQWSEIPSYLSAKDLALPPSGKTIFDEDDDISTVVPDDSVSCTGSSRRHRRRSQSGRSRRAASG